MTLKAIRNQLPLEDIAYEKNKSYADFDIIFTNLVDTDMLFGHRNDAKGYGNALEEIDRYMSDILSSLNEDDLLIVTADHGCDPTVEGTDHTREKVFLLMYNKQIQPKNLGTITGFDCIANFIKDWIF